MHGNEFNLQVLMQNVRCSLAVASCALNVSLILAKCPTTHITELQGSSNINITAFGPYSPVTWVLGPLGIGSMATPATRDHATVDPDQ